MQTFALWFLWAGFTLGPVIGYRVGKEVGRDETRRAILGHPSLGARRADKRNRQAA